MDYSDDEDFVLTQSSVMEFEQTNSCAFGGDIVDQKVSIESGDQPNFDLCGELGIFFEPTQKRIIYDNVEIEDISSDEELDKM